MTGAWENSCKWMPAGQAVPQPAQGTGEERAHHPSVTRGADFRNIQAQPSLHYLVSSSTLKDST